MKKTIEPSPYYIRRSTADDVGACQQIARTARKWLPFVMRSWLIKCADRGRLHVAIADGEIVGFVTWWNSRTPGLNTLHEVAVHPDYAGRGIGRNLIYSVPTPYRLKCKADNPACEFYERAGLRYIEDATARSGAPLRVYGLDLLTIHVQGNNKEIPDVTRRAGMAYGTRHVETPRDYPLMTDIHWKKYEWDDYMDKVRAWRPWIAMVPDYEHPSQRRLLYARIRDLKAAGVGVVMVCPKFDGAVKHIPSWCRIAVSIPSGYAGFVPSGEELKGRDIHCLGGSPHQLIKWIPRLNSTGRVVSVDYNAHTATAAKGGYWDHTRSAWKFDDEPFTLHGLSALSGGNIRKQLTQIIRNEIAQPELFAA